MTPPSQSSGVDAASDTDVLTRDNIEQVPGLCSGPVWQRIRENDACICHQFLEFCENLVDRTYYLRRVDGLYEPDGD